MIYAKYFLQKDASDDADWGKKPKKKKKKKIAKKKKGKKRGRPSLKGKKVKKNRKF